MYGYLYWSEYPTLEMGICSALPVYGYLYWSEYPTAAIRQRSSREVYGYLYWSEYPTQAQPTTTGVKCMGTYIGVNIQRR